MWPVFHAMAFSFPKDATIDALDLVLDGVDTIWGWVAGSKEALGVELMKFLQVARN